MESEDNGRRFSAKDLLTPPIAVPFLLAVGIVLWTLLKNRLG